MEEHEYDPSSVTVRKITRKGRGVFTRKPVSCGTRILIGKPVGAPIARSWESIQMDTDLHIRPDAPFVYVNHSCDPTCGLKLNSHGAYDLIALCDIAEGEEITFDYCMCEWEIVGFSECQCGSEVCRKIIRGAKYLPETFFKENAAFIAPYYQKLITD